MTSRRKTDDDRDDSQRVDPEEAAAILDSMDLDDLLDEDEDTEGSDE